MTQYRKKPVVIEAWQYTRTGSDEVPDWLIPYIELGTLYFDDSGTAYINTLEGKMEASDGDWIIRGVQNEIYPCKPDIFEETYDRAED